MKKLLVYIDISKSKISRTIPIEGLEFTEKFKRQIIKSNTMINFDIDKNNNLVGIEILGPCKPVFVDWSKALKVIPKKKVNKNVK